MIISFFRFRPFLVASDWSLWLSSIISIRWLLPCTLMVNDLRLLRLNRHLFITYFALRICFDGFIQFGFGRRLILSISAITQLCINVFFSESAWKSDVCVSHRSIFSRTFWVRHSAFLTCFKAAFWSCRQQGTLRCFWTIFVFSQAIFSVCPWTKVSTLVIFRP